MRVRAGYREAELGGVESVPAAPNAENHGAGASFVLRDRLPVCRQLRRLRVHGPETGECLHAVGYVVRPRSLLGTDTSVHT